MQKRKVLMSLMLIFMLCLGMSFAENEEVLLDQRGSELYKIDELAGESLIVKDVMSYGQADNMVYYITTKGRFYMMDLSTEKASYVSAGKSDHKVKNPIELVVTQNADRRTFVTILSDDSSTKFYEIKSKKYYYLHDVKGLNEAELWTNRMTVQRHYSKGYTMTQKNNAVYVTLANTDEEIFLFDGVLKAEKESVNKGIRIYYVSTAGDFKRYNLSSREIQTIKDAKNVKDFKLIKQGQFIKYVICLKRDNTYHAYKLMNGVDAKYLGDVDGYNYDAYALMKLPEYEDESTFEDNFSRMPTLEVEKGKYDQTSSFDGSLQSSLTDDIQSVAFYKGKNMKDGTILTNIVLYNGANPHGNAGVVFRADEASINGELLNGYYVGAKPSSSGVTPVVVFGKFVNGKWYLIKQTKASINVGNNQKLYVEAYGNHFKVYHDGKVVIDAYDNSFSKGKIGFRAWNMPALYKDFTVRSAYVNEFTSTVLDLDVITGMYNKVHQFSGSLQNIVTDDISVAAIKNREFENGYITTDMAIYRGDNVHGNSGVFFRVQDYTDHGEINNGYYVGLKAASSGVESAVIFGKFVDGEWHLIKEVNPKITYGENHNQHLVVQVQGDLITVGHDDDLMFQVKDNTFTDSGDVGYRSWRSSALYKHIRIVEQE